MRGRALPIPLVAGLLLPALLAACGERGEDPGTAESASPAGEEVPLAPAFREGILIVDGRAEPMTLRRYESPASAPLSFSTYLPDGVEAVEGAAPGEPLVRFVHGRGSSSAAGAAAGPAAGALELTFLPPETTEEEARRRVRAAAEAEGAAGAADSTPWGLVQHRFAGPGAEGLAALGRHGGLYFQLLLRHAPERREVFLPRAEWILEEWLWEESGEPLRLLDPA